MIEGKEYPLQKIFSDDFVFSIPLYQRPYSWTVDEAGELLEDLTDFMEKEENIEHINEYFLGSIVLIKDKSSACEVVDGQQRLTTLTILLSVLRDLTDEPEDIETFICQKANSFVTDSKNQYRLTLRKKDQEFFNQYIQTARKIEDLKTLNQSKLSESQANICLNALYFLKQLQSWEEAKRKKLTAFLINKCYLVAVSTPDMQSAFRIFSILNDRGLDLSFTDILKSDIIGGIKEEVEQKEYTKKWEDVEEHLGRDGFKDLFAHIRMIKVKKKPKTTILEEVRKQLEPEKRPTDFIDNTIIPYEEAFSTIVNEEYKSEENAGEINNYLSWLNRIDNFDWIPPSILYFSKYNNNPEEILKFCKYMDRLASGLMIIRANINYRLQRYGKLLEYIEDEKDLYSSDSPLLLTDEEKRKTKEMLNSDLYLVLKIRTYVILKLESLISSTKSIPNSKTLTVEHVLPQNPKDNSCWIGWFPTEQDRIDWTHKIGNLVLLTRRKNSQASNYDFETKKKKYFTIKGGVTNVALTSKVLSVDEWDIDQVEELQKEYVKKLTEHWDL